MPAERAVFAFEGSYEVTVSSSLDAAMSHYEAIDVANGEFDFFGDDGSLIEGTTVDQCVVLTLTGEQRPNELRERLQVYLQQEAVPFDPELADDPRALAQILLVRQRERLWPRWPRWLHRRVHGGTPLPHDN